MAPVYLAAFVRASTLHVGGAAAAASLRTDLVEHGPITREEFNQAFAVARLTPGTNFLALFTLLGLRLAGSTGAAVALAIGAVLPAAIAIAVAAVYVRYAAHPIVDAGMQGARAGALAVFLWAVVRLVRPVLQKHRTSGAILGVIVLGVALSGAIPSIIVLLLAGAAGAVVLR